MDPSWGQFWFYPYHLPTLDFGLKKTASYCALILFCALLSGSVFWTNKLISAVQRIFQTVNDLCTLLT
jgi:CHASE3 domain sensor protein